MQLTSIALICLTIASVTFAQSRPGGISEVKTPTSQTDPDVLVITADAVKKTFTSQTGTTPKEFYVVSYGTQVVRGTNYFAKVRIDTDNYVHLRVYQDIPMNGVRPDPQLHGIQKDKKLADPIDYFDANVDNTVTTTTKSLEKATGGSMSSYCVNNCLLFALLAIVGAILF